MIPKYYKERKEKTNFEKNSSTTTFTEKKTSTWCVLLSPFLKKGVAQFVWSALEKKTTISTKNISDGCNHFHFLSAVKLLLLDILYISCGTI